MFERYTEKARRVIFFARFEASQFGAGAIESEHILLGLLRADEDLTNRFLRHPEASIEAIREKLKSNAGLRERISTTVDLPLSEEAKRVLAYAVEESETLGNHQIGTDHLLLGLLREEDSTTAGVLAELGLRLGDVRHALSHEPPTDRPVTQNLSSDQSPPADLDDRWLSKVVQACIDSHLFTQDELAAEFEQVAALRQFRADVEALLRLLSTKGLVEPQNLSQLALDLRDEKRLAEFIERLRQG
jgi:ATP-dependent Clp protease ATP-binding subunit ClpC